MSAVPRFLARHSLLALTTMGILAACTSKVVDLGPGNATYSTALPEDAGPNTANTHGTYRLVDRMQGICVAYFPRPIVYTVASSRLYWIDSPGNVESFHMLIRGCDVNNCAATIQSTSAISSSVGGEPYDNPFCPMYWIQTENGSFYWVAETAQGLVLMRVSGETGAPIQREELPFGRTAPLPSFLLDQGVLYASTDEGTILLCTAGNCTNTLERLSMNPPPGAAPFSGDYAWIFGKDADYLYVAENHRSGSLGRLLRIPLNTEANFEELATRVGFSYAETARLHGDNLYWLEGASPEAPLDQLITCPKSGCVGAPKVLMSGLSSPSEVAVDGSDLYIVEQPAKHPSNMSGEVLDGPGHILKCSNGDCTNPEVIYTTTTEYLLDHLVIDERFVYFSGNSCTVPTTPYDTCGSITAIAK